VAGLRSAFLFLVMCIQKYGSQTAQTLILVGVHFPVKGQAQGQSKVQALVRVEHVGEDLDRASPCCGTRQAELQERLASAGLSKSGNKADLVARLTQQLSSAPVASPTSGEHSALKELLVSVRTQQRAASKTVGFARNLRAEGLSLRRCSLVSWYERAAF
jgi:hypothetical protein